MKEALIGALFAIAFVVGLAWGFDRFIKSIEKEWMRA